MKKKFVVWLSIWLSLCLPLVACANGEKVGTTLTAAEKAEVQEQPKLARHFREEVRLEIKAAERAAAEAARLLAEQQALQAVELQKQKAEVAAAIARRKTAEEATASRSARYSGPVHMDAAFWRRLANCENADGDNDGNGGGYFQFSPDTARKVGYRPGASYEAQVGMAQRWLSMIGGPKNGGSRSGWPHCWWVALRG